MIALCSVAPSRQTQQSVEASMGMASTSSILPKNFPEPEQCLFRPSCWWVWRRSLQIEVARALRLPAGPEP